MVCTVITNTTSYFSQNYHVSNTMEMSIISWYSFKVLSWLLCMIECACLTLLTHSWYSIWGNGETYLPSNGSDSGVLSACPCWIHWTLHKDRATERYWGSKHWTQNRAGYRVQCQWQWIYASDWDKRPKTCRVTLLSYFQNYVNILAVL